MDFHITGINVFTPYKKHICCPLEARYCAVTTYYPTFPSAYFSWWETDSCPCAYWESSEYRVIPRQRKLQSSIFISYSFLRVFYAIIYGTRKAIVKCWRWNARWTYVVYCHKTMPCPRHFGMKDLSIIIFHIFWFIWGEGLEIDSCSCVYWESSVYRTIPCQRRLQKPQNPQMLWFLTCVYAIKYGTRESIVICWRWSTRCICVLPIIPFNIFIFWGKRLESDSWTCVYWESL